MEILSVCCFFSLSLCHSFFLFCVVLVLLLCSFSLLFHQFLTSLSPCTSLCPPPFWLSSLLNIPRSPHHFPGASLSLLSLPFQIFWLGCWHFHGDVYMTTEITLLSVSLLPSICLFSFGLFIFHLHSSAFPPRLLTNLVFSYFIFLFMHCNLSSLQSSSQYSLYLDTSFCFFAYSFNLLAFLLPFPFFYFFSHICRSFV